MKKALLTFLVGAAGLVHADIRAVTPVPQNADPNGWWMKRHAQKMELVRKGGSKVVFIGDSITHFWESNGRRQWERYFAGAPYNALDLGYSADRTEHVLWRLDNGELDGYEAKCVILMIGTNNTGHNPFERETPIDTIIGIRAVLDKIRAKQPKAKIVLCPIFPRGATPQDGDRMRNAVVNREIRKFADGRTVFWCDFTDQFLLPDGTLPAGVMPDRLHPGAYGYEVWAAAVIPYVNFALADDASALCPQRFAPVADAAFDAPGPAPARPASLIGERESWWRDPEMWFHALRKHRAETSAGDGAYDLVFLGDSITHGWEGPGAAVLADLRKVYKILPLGIGGDRVQHNIWRVRNGELSGYAAKAVMLMIGTNNNYGDSPRDVAAGIRQLLADIRAKQPGAKIVLVAVFPRGEKPTDKMRRQNAAVNALIKDYADGKDVIWLDFTDRFLQDDGTISRDMMPDFLHPTAAGYRIWADAARPVFKAICGK
ncbi:MAG: GDSL-type esterase/lipase family protein [Kiritimatiellia bacterium]